MSSLYNNYFAKDKPLRHYSQHLIVAALAFFLLQFFKVELSPENLAIFLTATYAIDLDGVISLFILRKRVDEANYIINAIRSLKIIESATLGVMHHKKLNRLLVHNIVGFGIIIFVLFWALKSGEGRIFLIAWAILFHFVFDILDDIYQLGHIKNWLWPITSLKLF